MLRNNNLRQPQMVNPELYDDRRMMPNDSHRFGHQHHNQHEPPQMVNQFNQPQFQMSDGMKVVPRPPGHNHPMHQPPMHHQPAHPQQIYQQRMHHPQHYQEQPPQHRNEQIKLMPIEGVPISQTLHEFEQQQARAKMPPTNYQQLNPEPRADYTRQSPQRYNYQQNVDRPVAAQAGFHTQMASPSPVKLPQSEEVHYQPPYEPPTQGHVEAPPMQYKTRYSAGEPPEASNFFERRHQRHQEQ